MPRSNRGPSAGEELALSTRIAMAGAAGRMGRAIVETVLDADSGFDAAVGAGVEHRTHVLLGQDVGAIAGVGPLGVALSDSLTAVAGDFDVLIDFTLPEATLKHLDECVALGKPIVIGTTGLSPEQRARIGEAATQIPVVFSPNMSIGVNLMFRLVAEAARVLGDTVDIEVIEAHHRHKIDAPSGTAVRLGEILADTLNRDLATCAVYGREGRTGARDRKTIGFETIRAGDIVGEHTVMFAATGERLEITHRAASRRTFAQGAVMAACWLASASPGLYDMQDVLS